MKRFIVLIMVAILLPVCTASADITTYDYDGFLLTAYTPAQWKLKENDAMFATVAYYDFLLQLSKNNKTLELNNYNELLKRVADYDGIYVGHDDGIYGLYVASPTSYMLISYYPETNHLTYIRQNNTAIDSELIQKATHVSLDDFTNNLRALTQK